MTEQSVIRKLMVEVCNANNLMPKDGQGTASAYVLVDFDGQRRRTKTKFRDLNPQWDEKFEFLVHDAESMASETLELNVYNDKKSGKRSPFLGKVKISGSTFVKAGSETLVYYPLEKRSVFSQIKGEIGLKICYVDDAPPPPPPPSKEEKPAEAEAAAAAAPAASEEKPAEKEEGKKPAEEKKKDEEAEKKNPDDEKKPAEDAKKEEKPPEDKGGAAAAADPPPPSAPPAAEEQAIAPAPLSQTPPPKLQSGEKSVTAVGKDVEMVLDKSLSNIDRRTAFDLVDHMPFLYVRVVKAKLTNPPAGSSTYAKLVIGTHTIQTKSTPGGDKGWDQVFAFDKESLNSGSLEIAIWAEGFKAAETDEKTSELCLGTVSFDLQEVPKRVPPDSPLAPQWYSLEGGGGEGPSPGNDVMLSVWLGTQADEAFQEAWQSDSGGLIPETRAKVYLSPKLWYLRLTVIQTQDLQLGGGPGAAPEAKARNPELYVKAQLGPQLFKTSRTNVVLSSPASSNPTWNEDLIFVAAEPFEPFLVITVEDVANGYSVGYAKVQVASIDKRMDDKSEPRSMWFNLCGDEKKPYAGRIHVRLCLEGGYHVLDEAAHVTSDVRATAKQLCKPPIGLLEVGLRGATNLLPVKTRDGTRGTTDAYVVAKYGPKWVRTRTILDRFNPRWNEQYTWDVYDPCTVLTIGVFDNGRYKHDQPDRKDVRLGKLRVRLSTLDTNRVYMGTFPLMVLLPGGAKKMGEIEIAFRFSCPSWISLVQLYTNPMLPRMHYVRPFGPAQQDILRHMAMRLVTARLARSEPALGQEVVQFMLDSDTHMWSMRRSKANWFRVVRCLSKAATFAKWIDGIRTWVHPPTTILVHILLMAIVLCPHLILPTICMYSFLIIALRFRYRQRAAITMDGRLSQYDGVGPDELDEEFDGFPTGRSWDQVRIRYDRLRALAGRAQTLLGDLAAQGERLEALFNWRDPRATGMFVVVCLIASLVFYAVPFKVLVLGSGFYYFRHPRFRGDMPSVPINFFRRLPPLSDQIL
ncbi:OLC1v1028514C1 [Oldenlandia corymbosa var. corymbosa]|uniref:OLC1v1028514C1 n=1 Tax=Oldenlandia corymbosa var. corymbosa TaxID=529605 RepID=A0AAV1CEJ9_OLDCO|nr:OLC1v1028514C1 [Oldenlandia corymbosa var. corymbosa]